MIYGDVHGQESAPPSYHQSSYRFFFQRLSFVKSSSLRDFSDHFGVAAGLLVILVLMLLIGTLKGVQLTLPYRRD